VGVQGCATRRTAATCLALLLGVAGCTAPGHATAKTDFAPGAAGIGDPYFPAYGNGGYEVAGYDLDLRYDPSSGELSGTATVTATATQDLSRFDLDLAHLTASRVTVDGAAAASRAEGNELVVTPAAGIARNRRFTVVVDYAGTPAPLRNSALGDSGGWLRTADGAVALGEPESASTWFPVNDHPADKATFALAMTVPDGLQVLSDGVPGGHRSSGGWTTWRWSERSPMASYLTTVLIGRYRVTTSTHAGRPMVTAVPAALPADGPAARTLARTGEIADFLATRFGPYPFDAYGGVVVDDARITYALETQTRPVYGAAFFGRGPNPVVVAHELAHQWYGDSVAIERWKDIWLNEGFATYAEWLWQEHEGQASVQQSFDRAYRDFDWRRHPGDPGPGLLFGSAVYQRGAMTLHALRRTIGDAAFFGLLRSWAAGHRDGNVTTADFVAAAEKASGRDLAALFNTWLYGTARPPSPG
jgi:aminopeptidase N